MKGYREEYGMRGVQRGAGKGRGSGGREKVMRVKKEQGEQEEE